MPLIDEKDMPAPRLELRWEQETPGSWSPAICRYNLVLPLGEHDIRREERNDDGDRVKVRNTWTVDMGSTRRNGGTSPLNVDWPDGRQIDTPYRDGAHALWDAKALGNLPVYAVCEGKAMLFEARKD